MEYYHLNVKWRIIHKKFLLFFTISSLFFTFLAAYNSFNSTSLFEINFGLGAKADFSFQRLKKATGSTRRILGGLGSSPPRCTLKCDKCTPCHPVHVTVPPGTPVTAEYYPEAWRCKCGNKLYMP
ncbi:EPIDERMAL PATTERNING FACTOR-like protein 6 [Capsicum chacoense]